MPLGLALADGSRWRIEARDDRAAQALAHLRSLAGLRDAPVARGARLLVRGAGGAAARPDLGFALSGLWCAPGSAASGVPSLPEEVNCRLPPEGLFPEGAIGLKLLNVPAYYSVLGGGLLLHAALVAHEGRGFLLAGRSGAGKSTASGRVPPPWEALCDDMVLAVRDRDDAWQVHPWPTWGAVLNDRGGSWRVERALPLGGVYFLEQASREEAHRLGGGEAACLLNESAEAVSWLVAEGMAAPLVQAMRLRQFENLSHLARQVPCHRLRLSLRGAFWETIQSSSLVGA